MAFYDVIYECRICGSMQDGNDIDTPDMEAFGDNLCVGCYLELKEKENEEG